MSLHIGVLYDEHRANMYAREAKGQTASITALDLATGDMLWRSAPLVANAQTFAVVGGGIVCGYGFTAEPRFMFVLDRAPGAKKQTLQTSTGPEYIIPKGRCPLRARLRLGLRLRRSLSLTVARGRRSLSPISASRIRSCRIRSR